MVRLGIDRLTEFSDIFSGKRIALLTGASGLDSELKSSVDCFNDTFGLSLLLAPEHGVRGELQPGEAADDFVDPRTGIKCVSLFSGGFGGEGGLDAAVRAVSQVDVAAFDIQDAGSRYYTFASTLFYLMHACAKADKPLVVMDRPNPIGGIKLEGNTHREENLSFIGRTHVPIRHAMTLGEMARYFNGEYHIGCRLTVAEMTGWKRSMWYDETGLFFTPPSPNLPNMDSLALYNGTCLFAGTNISEGRGTTEPFTLVGAPFVDGYKWARRLNDAGLPGVRFSESWFIPQFSKYAGEVCGGVRIHVKDRKIIDSVRTGVTMLVTARELFPEFGFRKPGADGRWHIDIASGTDDIRKGVLGAEEICRSWQKEADAFRAIHEKYAIYTL